MAKRKKKKNYVNNADFLDALIDWKKNNKPQEDEEYPPVTEYIGQCFFDIADRLSRRPNFAKYTYREDMVLDGVENCLKCVRNFDPTKSKNPFAYFTQVTWYAFLRRIEKENTQEYIKLKQMESHIKSGATSYTDDGNGNSKFRITSNIMYDNMFDSIRDFEEKLEKKKRKTKKRKALEVFIDVDDKDKK